LACEYSLCWYVGGSQQSTNLNIEKNKKGKCMKKLISFLSFAMLTLTAESATGIHCKGVKDPLFEVRLEKGESLSRAEIERLPSRLKKKIAEADEASKFKMIVFRGEATPQLLTAVGVEADVQLQVLSTKTSDMITTYLDELGPSDSSSTLRLGRKKHQMSCDVI
jgi:hypothetical protein